jgi:hypothetical protein
MLDALFEEEYVDTRILSRFDEATVEIFRIRKLHQLAVRYRRTRVPLDKGAEYPALVSRDSAYFCSSDLEIELKDNATRIKSDRFFTKLLSGCSPVSSHDTSYYSMTTIARVGMRESNLTYHVDDGLPFLTSDVVRVLLVVKTDKRFWKTYYNDANNYPIFTMEVVRYRDSTPLLEYPFIHNPYKYICFNVHDVVVNVAAAGEVNSIPFIQSARYKAVRIADTQTLPGFIAAMRSGVEFIENDSSYTFTQTPAARNLMAKVKISITRTLPRLYDMTIVQAQVHSSIPHGLVTDEFKLYKCSLYARIEDSSSTSMGSVSGRIRLNHTFKLNDLILRIEEHMRLIKHFNQVADNHESITLTITPHVDGKDSHSRKVQTSSACVRLVFSIRVQTQSPSPSTRI